MVGRLQELEAVLGALPELPAGQRLALDIILVQVTRYIKEAFSSVKGERRGAELNAPLDAALKTAIVMLESIDTLDTGLDDALAKELRKTYEKYLGTFKV